jgi:cellulose synthase/poly-beta-1,6-N-acetylglucosamine synthase-like glycosyltransferase
VTAVAGVLLGGLALLAIQAALNVRSFARLSAASPAAGPTAAVLLPARNEAARIGDAVGAWLAQTYEPFVSIVYDDDSTDGTRTVALTAAAGDARLRVMTGGSLPPGWRGKPHACHRLRAATDAEILVFADADVVPGPDALARTVGALLATGADALSALPRHDSPRVVMRALVGLQRWAALALVPWWLARWRRAPVLAVVNGQFIAIRAEAYDTVGGFAAVRASLAEDVALGRRLAALGRRVAFLDGAGVLRCRPYVTFGELWEANIRNLAAALLGSSLLALGGAAALVVFHVVPIVGLLAGPRYVPGWPWWPLGALGLALLSRRLADRGAGHGVGVTLLHPLAVVVLAAMILESWRRARLGRSVEWRGRRYRATDRAG